MFGHGLGSLHSLVYMDFLFVPCLWFMIVLSLHLEFMALSMAGRHLFRGSSEH